MEETSMKSRDSRILLKLDSAGYKLSGILELPAAGTAPSPFPAVLLLHGFTSHKDEDSIFGSVETMFSRTTEALTDRGFAALRFDFRGHGESGGDFSDLTVPGLLEDVRASVEFLSGRKDIRKDYLFLLGQSMGGLTAAYAAREHPGVKAVALWNAPGHAYAVFSAILGVEHVARCLTGGWMEFDWEGKGHFTLKKDFFESLILYSPFSALNCFEGAVLSTGGTLDAYVRPQPQMAQAFLNAHPGENKLLIYPTDHTFNVKTDGTLYLDRAIEESISHFESCL